MGRGTNIFAYFEHTIIYKQKTKKILLCQGFLSRVVSWHKYTWDGLLPWQNVSALKQFKEIIHLSFCHGKSIHKSTDYIGKFNQCQNFRHESNIQAMISKNNFTHCKGSTARSSFKNLQVGRYSIHFSKLSKML